MQQTELIKDRNVIILYIILHGVLFEMKHRDRQDFQITRSFKVIRTKTAYKVMIISNSRENVALRNFANTGVDSKFHSSFYTQMTLSWYSVGRDMGPLCTVLTGYMFCMSLIWNCILL